MKRIFLVSALILGLFCLTSPPGFAASPAYPEVVFILDASGSMWGKAGSQTKIEAAKEVMAKTVPALPKEVRVGLVAYGHRTKGDCADVETLVPSGSTDRDGLLKKVAALNPKGKTPMAASIKQTAEALKTKENETTIVLVSDGIETCHDDPCGVVKALKQSGIKFVLHVVGFGVDKKASDQLACLAEAGGGKFFTAGDAQSLLAVLDTVKKEVAVKVEEAKTKPVQAASKLGKLEIVLPKSAEKALAGVHIIRAKDGKTVKEAQKVAGTHPLLAAEYKVVLLFAQPNYRKPDPAEAGTWEVKGGQTTKLELGAVVINIAKGLGDTVAGVGLVDEKSGKAFMNHHAADNNYYMFMPRAVPPGTYTLTFTFGPSKKQSPVAKDIKVSAGQEAVVTLDSGIQLKKAKENVQSWQLKPAGGKEAVLNVERRWDNDYPLWKAFPIKPGRYDLWVTVKGMAEPLPVGEGIEIKQGQTVVFDTGL